MNNSFSLTCSQCGGQIQLPKGRTRIKCPYCGTEQVLTGEVAQQVQMEGAHVCPVCHKDDRMEKVTAIVVRETRSSENRSFLAKMLMLRRPEHYDLSKPERYTTNIPSDPGPWNKLKSPKEVLKIALWIIGLNLCYMYNYFFHWIDVFPIETFLCSGLIIVLAVIWLSFALASLSMSDVTQTEAWHKFQQSQYLEALERQKKLDAEYQQEIQAYSKTIKEKTEINLALEKHHEQKLEVWRELYYCSRDDIVILPAEGLYAPARDMETFVNIQANRRSRE